MEPFLFYLGKVALAMAAFYIVFLGLFQNQKHFVFNRVYLLASMAVSYLIPLITFTITRQIEMAPEPVMFRPEVVESVPAMVSYEEPIRWQDYMFWGFLTGTSGFLLYFIVGNLRALRLVKRCRKSEDFGFTFLVTNEDVHPFSFFTRIIIPAKVLKHRDLKLILAHEKIHVSEKHTADIMAAELLFLLQWFNPFAWLMKDAVKNNLEYITDDYIAKYNDHETYQLAMVSLADKQGVAPFLNALNGSQLKNRIVMMKKTKQNRFALVKQLAIIPVLTLLIIGLSNKEFKAEIVASKPTVQNQEQAKVIKGRVTDENEKPLAGAYVSVYRDDSEAISLKRVSTNADGEYAIEVPSGTDKIFCFMSGFKKKEMKIGKKSQPVNFKLEELTSEERFFEGLPTKDGDRNRSKLDSIFTASRKTGEAKPLIILDGKPVDGIEYIDIESIEQIEVLKDKSSTILYGDKGKNGVLLITTKKSSQASKANVSPASSPNESEIFYVVEEMPEFPGGEAALREYIKANLKYPPIAKEIRIQGKVYVSFIVDSTGNVSKPKIMDGVDPELDKEALRIISSMPKWEPGKQRGRAVNVSFTVPIEFALQDGSSPDLLSISDLDWFNQKDPLILLDGKEINNMNELDQSTLKSIEVIRAGSSVLNQYGEKAKEGAIIITSKSTGSEVITTVSELRNYITKKLRYPAEAQKNNIIGTVRIYYNIDGYGKKRDISESEVKGDFVPIEEIVVTGLKNRETTGNKGTDGDIKLLEDEVRWATIGQDFLIPEFYGKTIRITVNFVLQD